MKEHNQAALTSLVRELESKRGVGVALAEAARWTLPDEIDRLLASDVDPDVRLDDGLTPLMYAGTKKSAERLLKAGADVNAKNRYKTTALMEASLHNNNPKILEILIKAGAEINARGVGGTALEKAAKHIRSGKGPYFLEIKTYRYKGHSVSDPGLYRTKEELKSYQAIDPVKVTEKRLLEKGFATEAEIKAIKDRVKAQVKEAVQFADASEFPPAFELYTDNYMQEHYPFIKD